MAPVPAAPMPWPISALMLVNGDMSGVTATTYIRMMGHTAAVSMGLFLASRAAS